MHISAGKRWVLAGAMMAALTTAEISVARAAPIPVAPETVILPDSGMTDVHYRRRYGAGRAFGGAALGILALGAAAAFANGNGYDDDTYYDRRYSSGYYPAYSNGGYYPAYSNGGYYQAYPNGGYRVYRRGYYGNGNHSYYGRNWRHTDRWGHSSRVGRNW